MPEKKRIVTFDREKLTKFLAEKEKVMVASGARVVMLNEKTKELRKQIEETDKRLRLML